MMEENKKKDWAVAISKGVLGAIPIVGSLAAEVIGVLIPNQRIDRIEDLLNKMANKLEKVPKATVDEGFRKPEFIDLLEDGMYLAAKSLSGDRIEQIANLLKNSLTDEETKAQQDKHLMSLLGELNDVEIVILRSYAKHHERDKEFWEKHEDVLRPRAAHMGSDQNELDEAAIYRDFRNHLARLSLIKHTYKVPKKGEAPEFDDATGTLKIRGHEITQLGRLLLRRIDWLKAEEY